MGSEEIIMGENNKPYVLFRKPLLSLFILSINILIQLSELKITPNFIIGGVMDNKREEVTIC
ncbi:hypothetical protein [Veronia pacifica]|uniref:hypothetical protein n=1 Tax=Veronia pacifica TaxID=1080227 RepID=UPI0015868729|nr:hypothetical protein [Veronia pacifica]